MTPKGSTRVAAVIGDPIRHSLSPVIQNAAFEAAGLDWTFVAFVVRDGDVPRALDGVRSLGIAGLSVTMPHKDAVAHHVDELDEDARLLGAVNCVANLDGHLLGTNTDGPGFVASLADVGFDPAGRRCAVLGAGGAARAVILALARAGAAEVVVINRTRERAEVAAALAADAGAIASVAAVEAVADAELIVNATSLGMGDLDPASTVVPLPIELVSPTSVVADLVMHPVNTPLLRLAEARGAVAVDGVGMLVHQAALAFRMWTGVTAPLVGMHSAVRAHLAAVPRGE